MKMWSKPVGQDDMTMLRDVSDEAVAENLKHRLNAGIIYVSIQFNIYLRGAFLDSRFSLLRKKVFQRTILFKTFKTLNTPVD